MLFLLSFLFFTNSVFADSDPVVIGELTASSQAMSHEQAVFCKKSSEALKAYSDFKKPIQNLENLEGLTSDCNNFQVTGMLFGNLDGSEPENPCKKLTSSSQEMYEKSRPHWDELKTSMDQFVDENSIFLDQANILKDIFEMSNQEIKEAEAEEKTDGKVYFSEKRNLIRESDAFAHNNAPEKDPRSVLEDDEYQDVLYLYYYINHLDGFMDQLASAEKKYCPQ